MMPASASPSLNSATKSRIASQCGRRVKSRKGSSTEPRSRARQPAAIRRTRAGSVPSSVAAIPGSISAAP